MNLFQATTPKNKTTELTNNKGSIIDAISFDVVVVELDDVASFDSIIDLINKEAVAVVFGCAVVVGTAMVVAGSGSGEGGEGLYMCLFVFNCCLCFFLFCFFFVCLCLFSIQWATGIMPEPQYH